MDTKVVLSKAQVLTEAGKYESALKVLGSVDCTSLPVEDHAEFLVAKGEALVGLGRPRFEELDEAIELLRNTHHHGLYARAKYFKSWQLLNESENDEARESLLESYAAFLRAGDLFWAAKAINRMAYFSTVQGRIDEASRNIERGVELYRRAGDEVSSANIFLNLGFVHCVFGNLRQAIVVFTSLSTQKTLGRNLAGLYMMFALVEARQGRFDEAFDKLTSAGKHVEDGSRHEAMLYEVRAMVSILFNDFDKAFSELHLALDMINGKWQWSTLVSQIKRLLGDVYFAQQKYDQARIYTDEALEVARKINERAEIAACYRLYAQLAVHEKKAEDARNWFTKSIDLFNMISSRYELAVTRFLAATSGLYPDTESTALLHMAHDYFTAEEVAPYISRVAEALDGMKKAGRIKTVRPVDKAALPTIITRNKAMKGLLQFAANVAQSEMTVLLTGDTGTGKDLMARYIHCHSGRPGEFVSVNAAAIPRDMVESELFGFKRGAFTGAHADRKGLLAQAENGTFYLNEIADTDISFQAKLLEVLESKRVRRLGENKEKQLAFRLIAATNHDLQDRVRKNLFRADLYHRLNEIPIALPPLSARLDDIPVLLEYALGLCDGGPSAVSSNGDYEQLCRRLAGRDWPGNIREFKAEVQRLWIAADRDVGRMSALVGEPVTMTREELMAALEATDWNRREVARIFKVSEGTIRYRMKKFDIAEETILP